jgi:uncharacterized membrane protein YoaK (UPF0700 family)
MSLVVVFIALIFFHSLVSRRIERNILTAPVLFTAAGMRAFLFLPELRERQGNVAVMMTVLLSIFTRGLNALELYARQIKALPPGPRRLRTWRQNG